MGAYRKLGITAKIIIPVMLTLFLTLGAMTWQLQSKVSEIITEIAKSELGGIAGMYANDVGAFLEVPLDQAMGLASGLSAALSEQKPVSRELVLSMLAGLRDSNKDFFAAGSAWEANAFDSNDVAFASTSGAGGGDAAGRFIPYLAKGQEMTLLEDLESSDYYKKPKELNRDYLTKPSPYSVGGKDVTMSTASAVVKVDGKFRGIVLIDVLLDTISQKVSAAKVYQSGGLFVVSEDGAIIVHNDAALQDKNVVEIYGGSHAEDLQTALRNKKEFFEILELGGEANFIYFYPINFAATGETWYLGVFAPESEVLASVSVVRQTVIITSFITLLLAMLVIYFVVRSSVKPVRYISSVASQIADGDLHAKIEDDKFGGEVLELSTALKRMMSSLIENIKAAEDMSHDAKEQASKAEAATREAEKAQAAAESARHEGMLAAASQLEQIVSVVSSASEELGSRIADSEHGAAEQAARTADVATAMEEMNITVMEVAKNAGTASEVSSETRQRAESGSLVVQKAVESILEVQQQATTLKEDMNTLDESAKAINQIMSVISDIADQTNLLALNAAIEAARAGDAGRGFAVVADEVRKLAEKTMASTTDVRSAIDAIQHSTTQSMHQVEAAVESINHATEFANQSGVAFKEIVEMVEAAADQVQAIATAAEEQSATSEEINRAIGEVNNIADSTSTSMQEASQAVSEMAHQTQVLQSLIEDIKKP